MAFSQRSASVLVPNVVGAGAAYDDGAEDEAFRLAATVRILCHQTATSSSLSHQLKLLPASLRFVDTSLRLPDLPPGAFAVNWGLCTIRLSFDDGTAKPSLCWMTSARIERTRYRISICGLF